ncbi:MAG: putative nicotinamide N-methyase [Bacillariaceae sp.]|jgi:predicted nicotinamide N-methyase
MVSSSSTDENKPRNFLCKDATKPFEFSFLQYGKTASIVVCQTAEDETWPGGSLWDVGVILSTFFVELAGFQSIKKESSSKGVKIPIPARLLQAIPNIKDLTVLELGCGVGLTGIVAAAVLGTKLTILTDLNVVVETVTESNVELNTTPIMKGSNNHNHKQQVCNSTTRPYRLTKAGKRGRIITMPLSWGNEQDEAAVMECFRQNNKSTTATSKSQRKQKRNNGLLPNKNDDVLLGHHPDLIIIGDVAYQQKPGAPSHFDVLLSTVLKFLGQNTIVVFGTRMRYVTLRTCNFALV